jgi:hypothetical protein
VVLKVSNRFFGAAVAGAQCFFGFRPRLFGMGWHGLVRAPLNLSASCECRPTRPDGGGGVTGGERTGGDLGGPRETDCVPGHIGFEPANPGAGHLFALLKPWPSLSRAFCVLNAQH